MSYYFIKNTAKSVRKMFPKIILNDLRKFPFKNILKKKQEPFIDKVDSIMLLKAEFLKVSQKFLELLNSDFIIDRLSKKLNNWYFLDWAEFEKELKKKKVNLVGNQKDDWFDRFKKLKSEVLIIQNKINEVNQEIDQMIYELYGLTKEEIEIIENTI